MSECPYCQNTFEMQDTCSDEFRMWQGLQGPYYIPTVDDEGVLSWTNTGGLPNPDPVDISGPAGASFSIAGIVETVADLPQSAEGVWLVGEEAPYDGYSYIVDSWEFIGQFAIGPEGPQGQPGATGASAGFGTPTATVDSSTGTPSVTVTASGPDTAKVFAFAFHNLKGDKGEDGQPGAAGQGVPTGGTAGQVLAKRSGTNFDTEWVNQSGGGGTVQSVNNVTPDQSGNITLTADDIGTDATNISIQDALDGYVHVGTSAPTDPTTKIWLDTDEPGMSAVSSVNGATGTVVLDAEDVGAMSKWELLWTNASPSSGFSAQTISLDLSQYKWILVSLRHFNDNTSRTIWIVEKNNTIHVCTAPSNTFSANPARNITANNTGVTFSSGYNASYATDNGAIPVTIYGIKGVVTT